jgi:hypothetical protein
MRILKIDVESCTNCGGRMKLRALVMTTASIERYHRWLRPAETRRCRPCA